MTTIVSTSWAHDGELLRRARIEGCRTSAERFVEKHYARAVNYAKRYTIPGAQAEDIVQEAFMNIWAAESIDYTQPNLSSYLCSAVLNTIRDYQRAERRRKTCQFSSLDEERGVTRENLLAAREPSPFTQVERIDALKTLEQNEERARRVLTPEFRDVFVLARIGFTGKQIASTLGVPRGTVKSRLFCGRSRVANVLCETTDPSSVTHSIATNFDRKQLPKNRTAA